MLSTLWVGAQTERYFDCGCSFPVRPIIFLELLHLIGIVLQIHVIPGNNTNEFDTSSDETCVCGRVPSCHRHTGRWRSGWPWTAASTQCDLETSI